MINKQRIASNFDHAASSYSSAAKMQRFAADELARFLDDTLTRMPQSIVEIGCGTGLLTERLRELYPNSTICATDIAPHMLKVVSSRFPEPSVTVKVADAETIEISDSVDLVASGLTVQWLDLERCLRQWFVPSRTIVFSTLVDSTLDSWREAFRNIGQPNRVMSFLTSQELTRACQCLPVEQLHLELVHFQQHFAHVHEFLRSLKKIGAHTAADNRVDAKSLRRVLRRFDSGITANYDIALCGIRFSEETFA